VSYSFLIGSGCVAFIPGDAGREKRTEYTRSNQSPLARSGGEGEGGSERGEFRK